MTFDVQWPELLIISRPGDFTTVNVDGGGQANLSAKHTLGMVNEELVGLHSQLAIEGALTKFSVSQIE